jgi:hypothetical protein
MWWAELNDRLAHYIKAAEEIQQQDRFLQCMTQKLQFRDASSRFSGRLVDNHLVGAKCWLDLRIGSLRDLR